MLVNYGALVDYSDPYLPSFPRTRRYNFNLQSIDLKKDIIQSFDLVVIATDHDKFDYDLVKENAKIIVDSRGRYTKKNNISSLHEN